MQDNSHWPTTFTANAERTDTTAGGSFYDDGADTSASVSVVGDHLSMTSSSDIVSGD